MNHHYKLVYEAIRALHALVPYYPEALEGLEGDAEVQAAVRAELETRRDG